MYVRLNSDDMKIITTREMVKQSKTFFDLAETERVAVKRGGGKFVNLIVADSPDKSFVDTDWIKEFMAIPSEYRCNPFDYSPSGDLFWADTRNVKKVHEAVEEGRRQYKADETISCKNAEEAIELLESL